MMREWLMSLIREAVRAEIKALMRSPDGDLIVESITLTLSAVEEIKEVLLEASRIKAIRDGGKPEEIKGRAPVRQRAFVGISQRRAVAEHASLSGKAHADQVRTNDIKAMEAR